MTTEQTKQATTGQLTENIEYYAKIQAELDRFRVSKDILAQTIIEAFEAMGNPDYFDTPSLLRARIVKGKVRESIKVEEARGLLSQDLFDKLLRVSPSKPFVTVRQLKEKEE